MASTAARTIDPRRAAQLPARGLCPSVHEPFSELDGALMRIRLPGGLLSASRASALARVAAENGCGPIELTNRANLQLRGIPQDAIDRVRAALVESGLAAGDAAADERRNVLASPTAGFDPEELLDARSLVASVAEHLASRVAEGLSPKFGVLIDGGGTVSVRGRSHDVALGARRLRDGSVRYEVRIADALPVTPEPDSAVWSIDASRALDVIDAVLAACAPFGRASELVAARSGDLVLREIAQQMDGALECHRDDDFAALAISAATAVGVHRERRDRLVWVGATPVLGRLAPATLHRIATLAARWGNGELRVTTARGLLVPGVAARHASVVVASAEELSLICDPDHPANAVVACAGLEGCASALADVQADARALIARLDRVPVGSRPRSIHVSGCEKGCASPRPTEVALVAGPTPGTYDLYAREYGANETRFGTKAASKLAPGVAIQLAAERTTPA